MPAAGAAVVDIGAIILVLAIFLLLYTLWFVNKYAPDFPIVGNVFKDYIGDPLAGVLKAFGHNIVETVWGYNVTVWYDSRAAATYIGNSALDEFKSWLTILFSFASDTFASHIIDWVNWAYNRDISATLDLTVAGVNAAKTAIDDTKTVLTAVGADITTIKGTISKFPDPTDIATKAGLTATNTILTALGVNVVSLQKVVAIIGDTSLPAIRTDIAGITSDIADIASKVSTLDTAIGPIVTSFPLIEKEIGDIVTSFPDLQKVAAKALQGVEALAPLLVLTGLSALAIDTLLNLAEDPCMCLNTDGNYGWIPLYVADQIATGHL